MVWPGRSALSWRPQQYQCWEKTPWQWKNSNKEDVPALGSPTTRIIGWSLVRVLHTRSTREGKWPFFFVENILGNTSFSDYQRWKKNKRINLLNTIKQEIAMRLEEESRGLGCRKEELESLNALEWTLSCLNGCFLRLRGWWLLSGDDVSLMVPCETSWWIQTFFTKICHKNEMRWKTISVCQVSVHKAKIERFFDERDDDGTVVYFSLNGRK